MLAAHLQECEHNPKKPVHCELGCGLVVPKDEIKVRISVKPAHAVTSIKRSLFSSPVIENFICIGPFIKRSPVI